MSDSRSDFQEPSTDTIESTNYPLVFISHDSRDAALAEAFSKLIKSVSSGLIKCFRSSDTTPGQGIDFGEDWYRVLMKKLQATTDVVCLFTKTSVDRPWILFEAGVAKGKLGTPVTGLAIGIHKNKVNSGPFYHFQNMDCTEADLKKFVHQLAKRIPDLEVDDEVLSAQISSFNERVNNLLAANSASTADEKPEVDLASTIIEEMKQLPNRVAELVSINQMPILEIRRSSLSEKDVQAILRRMDARSRLLAATSIVQDKAPWLYALAVEFNARVAVKDDDGARTILQQLLATLDYTHRYLITQSDFGVGGKMVNTMVVKHVDRSCAEILEGLNPGYRGRGGPSGHAIAPAPQEPDSFS